jgi:hypothetical protein
MDRFHALALGQNRVVVDTEVGHLRKLELTTDGRTIAPLHTGPWVNDEPIDRNAKLAPAEQALSGDFLCTPFCANDVLGGPIHGATANDPWRLAADRVNGVTAEASFVLSTQLMGATVKKTLQFRANEPFLYITHSFTGGSGHVPSGHHAMIRATGTAALSYSPKLKLMTPPGPPEGDPSRGRSLLRYPSESTDLTVPFADGRVTNVLTYPIAEKHEDIVVLVEAPGHDLGWTAAVRDAEDDIVLLIKDARVFPCTTLWMSNGGRDYAPWSGRHTRVLGLEDTRSFGVGGHRASIEPNWMSDGGIPTAFDLGASPVLRYAIGAIPRPAGWTRIENLKADDGGLVLRDVSGATMALPFATGWLLAQ